MAGCQLAAGERGCSSLGLSGTTAAGRDLRPACRTAGRRGSGL